PVNGTRRNPQTPSDGLCGAPVREQREHGEFAWSQPEFVGGLYVGILCAPAPQFAQMRVGPREQWLQSPHVLPFARGEVDPAPADDEATGETAGRVQRQPDVPRRTRR